MKRRLLIPALAILVAGCDANAPNDFENDAPPVVASAAFDFDGSFPEDGGARLGSGENWASGAIRVGVVTFAVGIHLLVPSVATEAATQATPYVEDGTWMWENTALVGETDVSFRLEATPEGEEIDWRMLISAADLNEADYDAFELYSATTSLDGQSGSWRLYYDIDGERTRVLEADFEVTGGDVRTLTFIIPQTNPNTQARGSVVRYEADADARLFDWFDSSSGNEHLVEWDAETKVGSITATDYNGGARSCWDENLANAPCE